MDGVEEHCNVLGISCKVNGDIPDLALERREKITEIAENREGYPPIEIQETFLKYR